MGKDKDMSKEELCQENERLSAEVERLQQGLEEVQGSLAAVDRDYQQSKASFSLARYGQLKDIVKKLISDEALKKVQSLSEKQSERKGGGMAGLLQKAREFAAHNEEASKEPPPPQASKSSGGKLTGLFKRIKYATGFSEDPPDVHCMNKEDIRRDNERKQREVQRLTGRGRRAVEAFHHLKERYQASKKLAPPARYQELKDMIKDVMAQTI